MLSRYDLGEQISEILVRVNHLEHGQISPSTIFNDLTVVDNFHILYDVNTNPNSLLFSDS